MLDITQQPYFNHNDAINYLMEPFHSVADVQAVGFTRFFPNGERFLISQNPQLSLDFYTVNQLYRYGLYENVHTHIPSSYEMWDHLSYAPKEIYQHFRTQFALGHGLTIIQQHGDYCDEFVFATHPGNNQINNFYLNQKELFTAFIKDFYEKMGPTLTDLASESFALPVGSSFISKPVPSLTSRQRDCAHLLIEGITAKEIARVLRVSHRTIETHINVMKDKFEAKNRVQLIGSLNKLL